MRRLLTNKDFLKVSSRLLERCFTVLILGLLFALLVVKAPAEVSELLKIVGIYILGGTTWSKIVSRG